MMQIALQAMKLESMPATHGSKRGIAAILLLFEWSYLVASGAIIFMRFTFIDT